MTHTETTTTTTTRPRWFRAGDRVRVVANARTNGFFAGELGIVWHGDRTGAVVILDSRGVADTRFINAELEYV